MMLCSGPEFSTVYDEKDYGSAKQRWTGGRQHGISPVRRFGFGNGTYHTIESDNYTGCRKLFATLPKLVLTLPCGFSRLARTDELKVASIGHQDEQNNEQDQRIPQ